MYKCGIDVGGTNIKFGIFDDKNNLIKNISIKTSKNKDEIVCDIISTIKNNVDINDVLGYTLALPSVLKDNIVVYSPNTNIIGINFYEILSKELNNKNIIIDNDANMAALAEARLSGLKDLVLITLGTGVGGGIIIDGKIYNKNGFAGEVGHIKVDYLPTARKCGCGKYGCCEAYSSAKNIVYDYNKINNTNITSKELLDMPNAEEYVIDGFDKLARMLSDITAVLSIKDIRFTGGMSNMNQKYYDLIKKLYLKYSLIDDINISQAMLGSEAGIYAAKYIF